MKELIAKYEIQAETLLKVIQHKKSTVEEIDKAAIARRFVVGFLDDLKFIKINDAVLRKASQDLLNNIDDWLLTGSAAEEEESKRLYDNLKEALGN